MHGAADRPRFRGFQVAAAGLDRIPLRTWLLENV